MNTIELQRVPYRYYFSDDEIDPQDKQTAITIFMIFIIFVFFLFIAIKTFILS